MRVKYETVRFEVAYRLRRKMLADIHMYMHPIAASILVSEGEPREAVVQLLRHSIHSRFSKVRGSMAIYWPAINTLLLATCSKTHSLPSSASNVEARERVHAQLALHIHDQPPE